MTVRVGIIGVGTMGRAHALTIERHVKNARIVCVCEPSEDNRAAVRSEIPGVAIIDDPQTLICSKDVDAVIIASPDATHAELTMSCVRQGKPVLCEKPLAETALDCRGIVDAENAAQTPLVTVGFMRRFDPAYRSLKAELDRAAIGKVRLLRCIHRNRSVPHFFSGTMGITNAMVHEFDVLRWLTGAEPKEVSVAVPALEDNEKDPILATIRMSDGVLADIEVFMNASYGYDIRTEVLGSQGILEMAGYQSTRLGTKGAVFATQCQDFVERFADAYRTMLAEWVLSVARLQATPGAASATDGLRAVEVAEAAVEAFRTGGWVEVAARRHEPVPGRRQGS